MKINFSSVIILSAVLLCSCIQNAFSQNWLTAGNALSGGERLGSLNAQPLNLITNGGSRLFIRPDGKIGVNTTNPLNLFTVRSSGGTPSPLWEGGGNPVFVGNGETSPGNTNFELRMASDIINSRGVIKMLRSRGSLVAPTAVERNDHIGSLSATGFDGTNFQVGAGINFYSDGIPTAGNVPTAMIFLAGNNSASPERLRISSNGNFSFNGSQLFLNQLSGNVGIGKGNLDFALGTQSIQFPAISAASNGMINMFSSGVSNAPRMVIAHSPSFQTWGLQYVDSSDKFNFLAAGSPVLTTDLASQRVGIGTSSPSGRFEVQGNPTVTSPVMRAVTTFEGSSDIRGILSTSMPADGWGYGIEANGGFRGGYFSGQGGAYAGTVVGAQGIASGSAGTRIGVYGLASGGTVNNWGGYFPTKTYTSELRVGGTTGATGYVAAINGRLIATEVRVETIANWPDYVFDKGYDLMPLDQLEATIKADKHLPGIPAANEMKENGIMVGEMQTKTMEKVEESTLYILQLHNRIKELEKKINHLAKLLSK